MWRVARIVHFLYSYLEGVGSGLSDSMVLTGRIFGSRRSGFVGIEGMIICDCGCYDPSGIGLSIANCARTSRRCGTDSGCEMKRIVIIADDVRASESIRACFNDYEVETVDTVEEAMNLTALSPCEYLFVQTKLLMGDSNGDHRHYRTELTPLRRVFPTAHLVVVSDAALIRETVKAVKAGADSYLIHPIIPEEVSLVREGLEEATRAQAEIETLRDPFWQEDNNLVRTKSASMRAVFKEVRQVAATRSTVLLTGETGTGKNVLAKLIYRRSNRSEKQFIGVHCGAIAETLLESELFGHERGAFTGAVRRKLGKFEIADGGTIFLDEVGTISPAMQIKLLEVLQERTIQRVGGEQTLEVDVRILAATNSDLKQLAESGSFRKDLYFRLNVFPIEIPPLRERREDIPLLVALFLERLNLLHQRAIEEVHPLVMEAFDRYEWPGNVRELESLMERAYILETSPLLTPESFPSELFGSVGNVGQLAVNTAETLAEVRRRAADVVERFYLKEQLTVHSGRINATARASGITERQLHKLMVKHGLRKEEFKRSSGQRVKKAIVRSSNKN